MKTFRPSFLVVLGIALAATALAQPAKDSTTLQKSAAAVCQCLSNNGAKPIESPGDFESIFLKCILDSASNLMTDLVGGAMETNDEGQQVGEAFGKALAMEMLKQNCGPFLQMSMQMAGENRPKTTANPAAATATITGNLVGVSDSEFLSLTLQTPEGRKQTFYYFNYVPQSDDWMTKPEQLLGKKVTITYTSHEYFRPKIKVFVSVKQLVTLSVVK